MVLPAIVMRFTRLHKSDCQPSVPDIALIQAVQRKVELSFDRVWLAKLLTG